MPPSQVGRTPVFPQKEIGTPYVRPYSLTYSNQIWGQPRPIQGSGVPSVPNFGTSYTCARTVLETVTKFCTVIKLQMCAKYLLPPARAENLSDTNADARSVCCLQSYNSPGNSPGAAAPGINDANLLVYHYSGLVQPIGLVDYLSLKKSI